MPYHFPYTNLHDLDLDWLLNQVKSATDKVTELTARIDTSDSNNIGTFKTLLHKLQEYSNILIAYMNYFNIPDETPVFTYTTADLTYDDETFTLISSVTTNPEGTTIGDYAQGIINQMVEDIQGAATDYALRYNQQTLTGAQRVQVFDNLGLNTSITPKNMFDLEHCWWCESITATDERPSGFRTLFDGFSGVGTINLADHSLIPSANNQLRLQAANRCLISTYASAGQSHTPSNYLAPGTYTLSLKITCLDPDNYPIPACVVMSGALRLNGGGGVNGYIDYTDSTTRPSLEYYVYGTSTRGADGADHHVYADNASAYFKKTFTVPQGDPCIPVCAIQFGRITTTQAPAQMYMFSDIQLEKGNAVTDYSVFGEDFTLNATTNLDLTELDILRDEMDTIKQDIWYDRDELPVAISDFLRTPAPGAKSDSFIFFTDSHPRADTVGTLTYSQRVWTQYGIIKKAARSMPNKTVFNGGDWMLSQLTDQDGFNTFANKMSFVYGLGKEMLGDKLHFVLGNHDFNNNDTSAITWNIPQGAIDALFPEKNDHYIIETDQIVYLIWNTGMSGAYSNTWATDQTAAFSAYMHTHPDKDYVFVQHIFSTGHYTYSESETVDDSQVYTPLTAFDSAGVPALVQQIVNLAKAYNTGGTYGDYAFTASAHKVRYIMAGHNHYQHYGIYEGVPVYICPAFGYMNATSSSPRDNPSYIDVINVIDTSGDAKTMFYLVNPINFDSEHTSIAPTTAPVQERNVVMLNWTNGVPSFTLA